METVAKKKRTRVSALAVVEEHHPVHRDASTMVMIPLNKGWSLVSRKIYEAMIYIARKQYHEMMERTGGQERIGLGGHMFGEEMTKILELARSPDYKSGLARKLIEDMKSTEVEFRCASMDVKQIRRFDLFSEIRLNYRSLGLGDSDFDVDVQDNRPVFVQWAYPPSIGEKLMWPGLYAAYDLAISNSMRTYAALALYCLLARYRDNPSKRTASYRIEDMIRILSQNPEGAERVIPVEVAERSSDPVVLAYANIARMQRKETVSIPKTGEIRPWRKFKPEKLTPALKQINQESDIEVELIEVKEGRSIAAVQFVVKKKNSGLLSHTPEDKARADELIFLGLTGVQADNFVKNNRGEHIDLATGRMRELKSRGQIFDNPAAYLQKTLSSIGEPNMFEIDQKQEGALASTGCVPAEPVKAAEREVAVADGVHKFSDDERAMAVIEKMDVAELDKLIDRAIDSYAETTRRSTHVQTAISSRSLGNRELRKRVIKTFLSESNK